MKTLDLADVPEDNNGPAASQQWNVNSERMPTATQAAAIAETQWSGL
jgi:hypothetical protein